MLATSSLTQAQTSVERGSYLVNGLLTCGNCHTPRGPGGVFAMDGQLSGGPQEWDRPTYKVRGANITQDKETGIGNWSEADLKRAITSGTRPNGAPLAPIMPWMTLLTLAISIALKLLTRVAAVDGRRQKSCG